MNRIRFQHITRAILLLVLLSAVVAIAWNLAGRHQEETAASDRDMLSVDVARRSVNFEHSEFRGGNLRFRVRAESDTLTSDGLHLLQQVELMIYNPDGSPSDWVRGSQAVYRPKANEIDFQEAVQIQLSDKTEIFSESLSASLDQQRIEIRQPFDFRRGEIAGRGGTMRYLIEPRRLEVEDGFQLWLANAASSRTTSQRAVYHPASGRLMLDGDVRASDSQGRLQANQLKVSMDQQRHVRRLSAQGDAEFRTRQDKVFSGAAIDFVFETQSGRLSFFDVTSSPQKRARFQEQTGDDQRQLQAGQLRVLPTPDPAGDQRWRISRFLADQDVVLHTPGTKLREMRSHHLQATFREDGSLHQWMMEDGVEVAGREGEHLNSGSLAVTLDESQQPLRIEASDNVTVSVPSADDARSLHTPYQLELDFQNGRLFRALCPRDCVLLSRSGATSTRLETPRMTARFAEGVPTQVRAEQDVRLTQQDAESRRLTHSRELTLLYQDGLLQRARQQGDFSWEEQRPGETSEMRAQRADFDPATQIIKIDGGQPLLIQRDNAAEKPVKTWARTFYLDRLQDQLSAAGGVRSLLPREGPPLQITAQTMRSQPDGWVEYRGEPVLSEGESRLSAQEIRILPSEERLEADQQVDSWFLLEADGGKREYRIRSQQMQLLRSQKTALYRGRVRATSESLDLHSEQLKLEFTDDSLSEVKRVTAWGGVEVRDATRTAVGERSLYFPAEGRVQVFGSPATVIDAKQGKARGAVLTFFTGDERLLVQNSGAGDQP